MYVRLAFAVAAHLEPEILIVDEVLAVGDAEFQKKCLGKMGEVAKQGRTVLFVSHNLRAILRLCSQALLLSGGQPKFYGAVQECVDRYLSTSEVDSLHMGAATVIPSKSHAVSDNFSFESINIEAANGDTLRSERFSSPLNIEVTFSITRNVTDLIVGIGVQTLDEFAILTSHSDDLQRPLHPRTRDLRSDHFLRAKLLEARKLFAELESHVTRSNARPRCGRRSSRSSVGESWIIGPEWSAYLCPGPPPAEYSSDVSSMLSGFE